VNQLGSFSFNSLADLEAGRPAAFTRQLSSRKRHEDQYVAGLSLGDAYKPTTDLQIQYGVRLDGNRFTAEPAENSDVERLFDARNDNVPNHIYVSPRVGFSWTYGTAAQIGGFDGAVRGPRAVVRGGVGVFQSTQRDAHWDGDGQHRARERGAAVELRRRRGADSRLARLCDERRRDPRAMRRRHHGDRVRQLGAERHAVRQELRRPARAPVEPAVERHVPRQPVVDDHRRDVLAESQPGEHVRSELQSGGAVR
jgi:hypothetical protein